MAHEEERRDAAEVTDDELREQECEPLPAREAMSAVSLDLGPPPLDPAVPFDPTNV